MLATICGVLGFILMCIGVGVELNKEINKLHKELDEIETRRKSCTTHSCL